MPCEVVLRPLEVGDAEAYARWMQDAELRELTGSEPLTADDMRRVASAAAADPATAAFLIAVPALAAELPPEGLVGDVNVRLNDADEPRRAELDVMVAEPTARRRGVAAQALLQAMKYGREAMGATSFVAKIIEGNAASVALFDSLGFRLAKRVAVFGELHYLLEDSEEK